ncbi:MAG: MBL fold metallo-hydrolase [Muribaculaceae bacterium]|nr:MBL fold metallo-hydrolase [Muribaculaceae bacterium]
MALKRVKNQKFNLFTGSLFDDEIPVHPSIVEAVEKEREKESREDVAEILEPMDDRVAVKRDSLRFISFGSGSSGNCSYIGDSRAGVLIDAGVDYKNVIELMKSKGLSMEAVKGILITHDHGDHIRYVYALVRRYPHIGVYCTPRCFNGIMRRHNVSRRLKDYHIPIYKEFPFSLAGMEITAFDVSHDGTDNAGFYLTRGADGGQRFTIATDLGCITPRVDYYMRRARWIIIESNYDARMLQTGPYPDYLKARIKAANGHLDNVDTARFLAEIWTPQLTHVFLCHLSQDNNTPDIAVDEVKRSLANIGIDRTGLARETAEDRACKLQLVALPRVDVSPIYFLE